MKLYIIARLCPVLECHSVLDVQTLAECTGSMDATTWNAYHIVSNRARSVCYSIQQQRFRKQTEVAVNKLADSTLRQLQAVEEIENKHQQLKDFTQESLEASAIQQC